MSAHDAALCARFGIQPADAKEGFHLCRVEGRLRLCSADQGLSVDLDLEHGPMAHRLRTARRSEPLPRAVGMTRRHPTVLDGTTGLGRDTMVLAKLGCRVTAVERIAGLAMLLADAVEGSPLAANLSIVHGDTAQVLASLPASARPDVVYLDPMFAEHGKAQVKKDTQLLRHLAGPPEDLAPLFALARRVARERVVLKRALGAQAIAAPDFSKAGGRVRFDVYLVNRG
jgi:16S rRNA (guanine1516-N2)-methyltransferase